MITSKVVVVIISFNGEKWIEECIKSILQNGYSNIEIVVVDNASKDKTISIIRTKFKKVILFEQRKNVGFGRGCNIGFRYAMSQKSEYVLLLNQDIKLDRHCIENMVGVCEKNKKIGIASPLQMDYAGLHIDSHFKRLYNLESETIADSGKLSRDSIEVDTIIGASMLLRSEVIKAIGGFDPIYFMYHEEGDLCRRAKYHGIQIHIVPKAIVCHKHIQLFSKEMSFKAKFSSLYGYYIFTLKNPFQPFDQNLIMMLKQMKKWVSRERNLVKIVGRFLINAAVCGIILICMNHIIASRASDIKLKK